MTGIDTNVLVRYITRDDPKQYRAAKAFLEPSCTREEPGYVSVIVLCELARVLARVYDATDDELAAVIDQLLRTHQLQIERRDQVRAALEQYKRRPASFPDCLLGRLNQNAGCQETITFDHEAAGIESWRKLETS
jgi:predicted nucleic-acid-binding protein